MNKLALILGIFITTWGAFGCTDSSDGSHSIDNIPTPTLYPTSTSNVTNWYLSTETSNKSFLSENIDTVILVKPETNDDCLIGSISGIFAHGDSIIVIDASKAQAIYVFDKDGKYISSIGTKGEGPDEYGSINAVKLNNNKLYILDWIKNQIVFYPLDKGEIGHRTFKEMRPDNFAILNNSITLGAYASYFEQNPFALTWIGENGEILQTSRPFTYTQPLPSGRFQNTFDNKILYHRNDCDTIFEIKEDCIIPIYTLGLGNHFYDFVDDNKDLSRAEFYKKLYTDDSSPLNMYDFYESNKMWIVHFQKGSKAYLSTVDKNNGKSKNYLRSDITKQEIYVPFVFFSGDGDHILSYIDNTFVEKVSEKDKAKLFEAFPYLEKTVYDYDFENLNPLICIMRLKQ